MNIRDERANSILLKAAAVYLSREAGRSTLITPTRADFSSDRKNATIFVSVFPSEESDHAIKFLTRHKDLFRDFLKTEARFPRLPFIRFELDMGERNRQHLDDLGRDMTIPDAS